MPLGRRFLPLGAGAELVKATMKMNEILKKRENILRKRPNLIFLSVVVAMTIGIFPSLFCGFKILISNAAGFDRAFHSCDPGGAIMGVRAHFRTQYFLLVYPLS